MESKPTFTISLANIDRFHLEHIMEVLQISPDQIKFVLDNLDNVDYRELIRDFLNKDISFKELKEAIK